MILSGKYGEMVKDWQEKGILTKDCYLDRYKYESLLLSLLTNSQLNLDKNVSKPNFEDMSLLDIVLKLEEEIKELFKELKYQISPIDAIKEIGDCAAVLTGLLSWILVNVK